MPGSRITDQAQAVGIGGRHANRFGDPASGLVRKRRAVHGVAVGVHKGGGGVIQQNRRSPAQYRLTPQHARVATRGGTRGLRVPAPVCAHARGAASAITLRLLWRQIWTAARANAMTLA